jgi:hypothetical protein
LDDSERVSEDRKSIKGGVSYLNYPERVLKDRNSVNSVERQKEYQRGNNRRMIII